MKIEYTSLNVKFLLNKKILYLLFVIILSGCAAANIGIREFQKSAVDNVTVSDTRSNIDVSKTDDEERIKLEGIGVQEIEGGKKVVILGSKPMSYTAFMLNDPSRLIIDIHNIDFGEIRPSLNVENSMIKTINTHMFGEDTGNVGRIEIEIVDGVEYELDSLGSTIYAKFMKEEESNEISVLEISALPEEANTDEDAYETTEPVSTHIFAELDAQFIEEKINEKIDKEVEIQKTKMEIKDLKSAEKLLAIDVKQGDDTTEVLLKADGAIKSFDSFRMSNTERIVIDLWGIKNMLSTAVLPLETPYTDRVRTGKHSDKTRVVIDLKSSESSYSVEQVPDGLVLAISQKEVKEKIKTALLPRNRPELSKVNESDSHDKEKSVVQITDVKFENNEDTSRVLITTLDKVEYDLSKSYDGKTLALIVKDAFLPENLQRTVDTSMLKGPAQRVSSFMSVGKTDNKAMIVVRLKEEVPYEVSQVDNLLALSFPKQQSEKSQASDKALSAKAGNETEKIAAKSSQLLKPDDSGEGKKEAQELKSKTAAVTPATVEKKSAAINKSKAKMDKIVSVKPQENWHLPMLRILKMKQ